MIRGASAAAIFALALAATGASAAERTLLVFGGPSFLNDWGEIVVVDDVTYSKALVLGVAGGLAWDLPLPQLSFSMEAQLARYVGAQQSWEVNIVPAMLHYAPRDGGGALRSLGFGLGFSYAEKPPQVELVRGSETSREKWYWTMEAAFATAREDRDYVLRLHHRSTGEGTIGKGRSTNALVFGIRQSF